MRIGVIGWGLRSHLARLAHDPASGRELVALCDPRPEARAAFLEFAGERAFATDSLEEFLGRELEAVLVLSPDHLHEEHAQACLAAGVSIYLEKPMATTVAGCDAILRAAAKSRGRLYVGHNMRHFPVVRRLRDLVLSGAIGTPKSVWCRHFVSYGGEAYFRDWHSERALSTGLLLQKGSHDLDVIHALAGSFSRRVTALGGLMVYGDVARRRAPGDHAKYEFTGAWPPREIPDVSHTVDVEDLSMMLMELENGVLASYSQCHFSPDAWRNYCVIGDQGRIENFGDGDGAVVRLWNKRHRGYDGEGDASWTIAPGEGPHGGADATALAEFFALVERGTPTDATPIAARMAVAAGVAGTESLRAGGEPVLVPPIGA